MYLRVVFESLTVFVVSLLLIGETSIELAKQNGFPSPDTPWYVF